MNSIAARHLLVESYHRSHNKLPAQLEMHALMQGADLEVANLKLERQAERHEVTV